MTQTPDIPHDPDALHRWVHEQLAAYLAGGLDPRERAALENHIHACPPCFDAFTDARDADLAVLRHLGGDHGLSASDHLEERLLQHLRETTMKRTSFARLAGMSIAAAVALAATGVLANHLVQNDRLSNPLTEHLTAQLPGLPLWLGGARPQRIQAVSGSEPLSDRASVVDDLRSVDAVNTPGDVPVLDSNGNVRYRDAIRPGVTPDAPRPWDSASHLRDGANKDSISEFKSTIAAGGINGAANTTTYNGSLPPGTTVGQNFGGGGGGGGGRGGPASVFRSGGLVVGNGGTTAGNTYVTAGLSGPPPITPGAWDQQLHGLAMIGGSLGGGAVVQNNDFRSTEFGASGGGSTGLSSVSGNLYDQSTFAQQNLARAQNELLANQVTAAAKTRIDPASGLAAATPPGNRFQDQTIAIDTPTTQPSASSTTPAPDVAQRKVIRNGTVEYEVRSFDDAYQTIASLTAEQGGYVSSTSSDRLPNGKIRGSVVVRVPPEKLDRLLLQLRGIGELKNQQIAASDVTKEYTDTESELRGLRAMEERMLDLIKNGKGEVKDLVEAEKQLGDYRVRIEKLEGELRYYNNLVAMATLTITAYEKDIQKAAAATEQETASIDLQTESVEEKLAAARKLVSDANGRVLDSGAKKGDNDQATAYLLADVPADKAESVLAGLRVLGQVVHFERARKQTLSGGGTATDSSAAPSASPVPLEEKDARITLSISNLASVPPRETTAVTLAASDVPAAYQALLAALRDNNAAATQPQGAMGAVGRVITSQMTGNRPEEITGNIQAEVRAPSLDKILTLLRAQGLILGQNVTQNSNAAATTEKEGLAIQIVSAATVPPRESTAISVAAADVPALYAALLSTLHGPPGAAPAAAPGRVTNSQLAGNKPEEMSAVVQGDISTTDLPKLLALLHDQGALLAQTVSQNTNAATMPTKEGLSIQIVSAATIAPRRITTLGIELSTASDVSRGLDHVRAALPATAAGGGAEGTRILQDAVAGQGNGRVTGQLTVDVPVADAMKVLSAIHDLGGDEKVDNVQINADAPDTKYATERFSLSLTSRGAIVESDQGIWPTIRAALSSALAALSWSLYLVLTGILFLLPWLLILWTLRKLWKRRPTPAA